MATTVLWCGQEDIDFPNGSLPYPDATAGRFNANYARYALYPVAGAVAKSTLFTPATAGWLSFYVWRYNDSWETCGLAGFCDSATSKALTLIASSSGGNAATKIHLATWNGSAWTVLASETGASVPNQTLRKLDMSVVSFGATAVVNVYVSGSTTPIITYTGDVTQSSTMTSFDCINLGPSFYFGNYSRCWISEVIFADGDTRSFRLITLAPSASGDTSVGWTGAYTDIDETTLSDADNVYSDTADSDFQCNLTDLPASVLDIIAINVAARAAKSSDATIGTLKLGVKSGTVDVDAGRACDDKWQTYNRIAHTINGAKLTISDCNALQLNLRSSA